MSAALAQVVTATDFDSDQWGTASIQDAWGGNLLLRSLNPPPIAAGTTFCKSEFFANCPPIAPPVPGRRTFTPNSVVISDWRVSHGVTRTLAVTYQLGAAGIAHKFTTPNDRLWAFGAWALKSPLVSDATNVSVEWHSSLVVSDIVRVLSQLGTAHRESGPEQGVTRKTLVSPWKRFARVASKQSTGKLFVKHWKHVKYLVEVSTKGDTPLISRQTASRAKEAWMAILEATDYRMPVPAACTGPGGEMFYSWDRGRHHLELEIIPGGPAEFFYRDRETEDLWGEDYEVGTTLAPPMIEKLNLFL